jgi:hypothetical protein
MLQGVDGQAGFAFSVRQTLVEACWFICTITSDPTPITVHQLALYPSDPIKPLPLVRGGL